MGDNLSNGWRWEHFTPEEVLSPIGLRYFSRGQLLIQPHALDKLEGFRQHVGKPLLINHKGLHYRGYRHPTENARVGGEYASYHMQGLAFDVTIEGVTPYDVGEMAKAFGWTGIGIYFSFTHLDVRPSLTGSVTVWQKGLK